MNGITKHTPGPWHVVEQGHRLDVVPSMADGRPASGSPLVSFKEQKSGAKRGESPRWVGYWMQQRENAALMAAAPELLAELKRMVRVYGQKHAGDGTASAICDPALAAIAKAEGRTDG